MKISIKFYKPIVIISAYYVIILTLIYLQPFFSANSENGLSPDLADFAVLTGWFQNTN